MLHKLRSAVHDVWFVTAIGITAGVAVASAIVGFAWLPNAQPGAQFGGWWDAICSAAGLISIGPIHEEVIEPAHPTTRVVVAGQTLFDVNGEAAGRGATLALRCTMCHGANGVSSADTPNLAGQYAIVIYKQLRDFKTGARTSAVMAPLVGDLDDRQMRDLAVYYGGLPRASVAGARAAPRIVADGAPMRGIAPCGACHGELGNKPGAPWLEGQPAVYLRAQLDALASGTRGNDISRQMRNIAHAMTPAEIDAATRYYAGGP